MDISKILFNSLKTDNIKSSFEDLDVNNDGVINNADMDAAKNTDIAKEILTLLNSVDTESEIIENADPTDGIISYSRTLSNHTQNELDEISEKISEKEEEYKKLQDELEEKQEEYAKISKNIENSNNEDEAISQQTIISNLSSEIKLLNNNLQTLDSDISSLKSQYETKSARLEIENNVAETMSKAGSTLKPNRNTTEDDDTTKTSDDDTDADNTTDDDTAKTDDTDANATTADADTGTGTAEYYSEDDGVNIANVAKLIADVYGKIDTDSDMQEAYKEYALDASPDTARDAVWESTKNWANYSKNENHKIMFAAHYILTNGTDEQKSALRALCPDAEDDLGVRRYVRIISSRGKNYDKDGRLKCYKSSAEIEANIINNLTKGDTNSNGYITETEASASITKSDKSRVTDGDPIRKYKKNGNFR